MSETVRVRVAIAVKPGGGWWVPQQFPDRDCGEMVTTLGSVVYHLTAELPIPPPAAPVEVPATVEGEGEGE